MLTLLQQKRFRALSAQVDAGNRIPARIRTGQDFWKPGLFFEISGKKKQHKQDYRF